MREEATLRLTFHGQGAEKVVEELVYELRKGNLFEELERRLQHYGHEVRHLEFDQRNPIVHTTLR